MKKKSSELTSISVPGQQGSIFSFCLESIGDNTYILQIKKQQNMVKRTEYVLLLSC